MEEMSDGNGIYTKAQMIVIEASSIFTGFVSLSCSLVVIYSQLKNRNRTMKLMYERIILGSSILDVIVSSGFAFLGVWAVPEEVDFVLGARGSFTTCGIAGFAAQFGMGALIYFAFLSIFFVLVIVFEIQERAMTKCFEPLMHSLAFGFPLASGIYALSINAMNPVEGLPGSCWINEYPPDCMTQKEIDALEVVDDDISPPELCTRGEGFKMLALVSGAFLMGITLLVVVVSMFCIVMKVYSTEKRLHAYMVSDPHGRWHNVVGGDGTSGSDLIRTRKACWKALLYIGSFSLTYFGLISYQVVSNQDLEESETGGLHFAFALCTKFLGPLHGFWQALIYFQYASRESRDEVTSLISGLQSSVTSAMKKSARHLFEGSAASGSHTPERVDPPLSIDFNPQTRNCISMISSTAERAILEDDEEDTVASGVVQTLETCRETTGSNDDVEKGEKLDDVEKGEKLDNVGHSDDEVTV